MIRFTSRWNYLMDHECQYCGKTNVRPFSFVQRVFSKNGLQYCSFSCFLLGNPLVSKGMMFCGIVIFIIPWLNVLLFPLHDLLLILCGLGIGILCFGSWYHLRYLTYRWIEDYILRDLCKNPQRPILLTPIASYASLVDASVDDVQFVISALERKRIITRTPEGIVTRLYF